MIEITTLVMWLESTVGLFTDLVNLVLLVMICVIMVGAIITHIKGLF